MAVLIPQAPLFPTLEGDSLEIVAAVQTGGVIHSPGFPVYMILAYIFRGIFFFFSASYAIALFSITCASASTSLTFWICRHLRVNLWPSLICSLLPLFALEVWYQSLIQEVYSLAILWMLLILQSVIVLSVSRKTLAWAWFSFLLTAGFGVHLYVWPMIPLGFFLVLVMKLRNQWLVSWKGVIVGGLLGILPFLYLPLMAGKSKYVNEGNITSVQRFVDHVTWKLHRERLSDYETQRKQNFSKWIKVKWQQLKYFSQRLFDQYQILLMIFILLLTVLIINPISIKKIPRGPPGWINHGLFFFCVGLFVNIWVVFAGSEYQPSVISEMEVHFVPIFYFFSIWLALAVNLLKNQRLIDNICGILSALLVFHVSINYSSLNLRSNDLAVVHGREILKELPENSLLFSQGDVDLMSIIYQQAVEGFRTDIQLINLVNGTEWYFDHLKATATVPWPNYYSKYFQLVVLEQNYGNKPIYFSNYYAALLVLQQPSIAGRFVVVPEKGGYKLTDEKSLTQNRVDLEKVIFSNFINKKRYFSLRDVEKDLAGQYMDYYSRRAELLSVFAKPELASQELSMGLQQPVFDSIFNQMMRENLLKIQKRWKIREKSL